MTKELRMSQEARKDFRVEYLNRLLSLAVTLDSGQDRESILDRIERLLHAWDYDIEAARTQEPTPKEQPE